MAYTLKARTRETQVSEMVQIQVDCSEGDGWSEDENLEDADKTAAENRA